MTRYPPLFPRLTNTHTRTHAHTHATHTHKGWNPYWGEDGYFRIKRGVNECNIEGSAIAASDDAVWSRSA